MISDIESGCMAASNCGPVLVTPPSPLYEPPRAHLRPQPPGATRAGRLLLLATVLLLITSLRNITGPWEHGLRGESRRATPTSPSPSISMDGLAVTHGLPGFVEVDGKLEQNVNHHHPPDGST